jgi:hypothetical protein
MGGPGVLTNCTFYFNVTEGDFGGGALAIFGATAELPNCILWNPPYTWNQPYTWYQSYTEQPLIAMQGTDDIKAELIISYSTLKDVYDGITQEGWTVITMGDGIIDTDPKFRDPAGADEVAGTVDDDLGLRAGSPCIDAGDNTAVPADIDDLDLNEDLSELIPLDLDGRTRFADDPGTADTGLADIPAYPDIVDIGAYEYTP